ncbi:hypothetical protein HY605_04730 [Candidatus Peregrinibacteria bacterium]|nr:hypothetical protein [Candidatus Peregrinibacteria bacterium]
MSKEDYFQRIRKETPTFPWINTAVEYELKTAIRWGAVSNSMNPTHPPKAIKTDRHIWQPVIDDLLQREPDIPDDDAVDFINQRIAERSAKMLFPIYEEGKGKYGYATIQSNPNKNDDLVTLMKYATSYSKIAVNAISKIPSTKIGAQAIEELTAMGINTVATMGFSVAQTIAMAEAYERGLKKSRSKPKCFVVIIPGIFCDYLDDLVKNKGISIVPEILRSAGVIISRLVYKIFKERGYKADIIAGGTRKTTDFTGLVGGSLHITHSFDTWETLIKENPPVVSRIFEQTPKEIISELENKFEDFKRACKIDGLYPDEFRNFGPCVKFNNACIKGHSETIAEIKMSREKLQIR